jgi:hypothetical protein
MSISITRPKFIPERISSILIKTYLLSQSTTPELKFLYQFLF